MKQRLCFVITNYLKAKTLNFVEQKNVVFAINVAIVEGHVKYI